MRVLLINPHLEFPSDTSGRSGLLRSKEYLLNMGLLSISSHLNDAGVSSSITDLSGSDAPLEDLENILIKERPEFVGISNQSCHSYLSTKDYAKLIKSVSKNIKVVVGGLHASGIPHELVDESSDVDCVVVGEGELVFENMVRGNLFEGLQMPKILTGHKYLKSGAFPNLDYTQYPDFQNFVPYVEESRGCVSKCDYCISPSIHNNIRIRSSRNISEDIEKLRKLYGADGFHFFLEANNFGVNHKRTKELTGKLAGANYSWRTESRVDTFPIYLLDDLVDSGLRVLDIGLESGSPRMLERMNKTRNPEAYLDAGIKLAEKIAKNGQCLLKFNMMLYYGETLDSVRESEEYLEKISSITPISIGVGPVRMDPGSRNYREFLKSGDVSSFDGSFWGETHCYPVDLSPEISFEDGNKIGIEFAQKFQSSKRYYEAKRHSQLPYRMSYGEFMKQAEDIPAKERQWTK